MTDNSAELFRTNEPYAEEIHHLIEIGMLIPVDDVVVVTPDLYRMVNRFKEHDPEPWIPGSEQCMAGNHLYVPLMPDEAETI